MNDRWIQPQWPSNADLLSAVERMNDFVRSLEPKIIRIEMNKKALDLLKSAASVEVPILSGPIPGAACGNLGVPIVITAEMESCARPAYTMVMSDGQRRVYVLVDASPRSEAT